MRTTEGEFPAIRVNIPTAGRLRIDGTGFTFTFTPDVGGRNTYWAWSDTDEYVGRPDKLAMAVRSIDGQSEAWMLTEGFAEAHALADGIWTLILRDFETTLKSQNATVLSSISKRFGRS